MIMKLSVNKSRITDVLSKIQGLTGRKSSLAITANVLMKATDTGVTIVATDLETGFEGNYDASVETGGAIAINARKLFEIVRDFPSDDILINEVDNHWIEIGNKNVEYHIVGMDPEDYPDIPMIEDIPFFSVDSAGFKRMIERSVVISGSTDDQRAHITGALFESVSDEGGRQLRIVSTDGFRLSKVDCPCEGAAEALAGEGILIPKKGLVEASKFLEGTGSVQVGFKDNHFILQREAETIMIRLLEGEFPAYGEVIEKGDGHDVLMDNQLFSMMLRRMSILASDNYKAVMFNFGKGKLTITSTNPDIGESKEDMVIDYEGDGFEVGFNPRYFLDALNSIDDDAAIMNIVDEEKRCLLEGVEDKSFVSAIMPMRM